MGNAGSFESPGWYIIGNGIFFQTQKVETTSSEVGGTLSLSKCVRRIKDGLCVKPALYFDRLSMTLLWVHNPNGLPLRHPCLSRLLNAIKLSDWSGAG